MAFTTSVSSKGGDKLKAALKKAEEARRSKVKVGFFSSARYEDGQPVAEVAAIQEFGGGNVPERPFFRQAIAIMEDELPGKLAKIINPETMDVSAADAAKIGEYAAGVVRDRIRDFQDPGNAESTILAKGKDDPLVRSGKMMNSVDYETV